MSLEEITSGCGSLNNKQAEGLIIAHFGELEEVGVSEEFLHGVSCGLMFVAGGGETDGFSLDRYVANSYLNLKLEELVESALSETIMEVMR